MMGAYQVYMDYILPVLQRQPMRRRRTPRIQWNYTFARDGSVRFSWNESIQDNGEMEGGVTVSSNERGAQNWRSWLFRWSAAELHKSAVKTYSIASALAFETCAVNT
mmetsp:Transcript_16439/g.39377  ORF Transcript_16439/g.39377 Transcript_16439/m.39377 type:complete len:107 (-) Transcript_16439:936-1256(-)